MDRGAPTGNAARSGKVKCDNLFEVAGRSPAIPIPTGNRQNHLDFLAGRTK